MKVSEPLIVNLKYYLGKQKQDACNALARKPLTITAEEAGEFDAIEFENKVKEIIKRWNALAKRNVQPALRILSRGNSHSRVGGK